MFMRFYVEWCAVRRFLIDLQFVTSSYFHTSCTSAFVLLRFRCSPAPFRLLHFLHHSCRGWLWFAFKCAFPSLHCRRSLNFRKRFLSNFLLRMNAVIRSEQEHKLHMNRIELRLISTSRCRARHGCGLSRFTETIVFDCDGFCRLHDSAVAFCPPICFGNVIEFIWARAMIYSDLCSNGTEHVLFLFQFGFAKLKFELISNGFVTFHLCRDFFSAFAWSNHIFN